MKPATPIDPTARRRRAAVLNLMLPGSGQFYLGQKKRAAVLLTCFLLPFFGAMAVFLVGLNNYFTIATSGNILEGDTLEQLGGAYHLPWLISLCALATADWVVSMVLLWMEP